MELKIIDNNGKKRDVFIDGKNINKRLSTISIEMKPQEPTKVTLVYYPKKIDILTFISERDIDINFK